MVDVCLERRPLTVVDMILTIFINANQMEDDELALEVTCDQASLYFYLFF